MEEFEEVEYERGFDPVAGKEDEGEFML